MKPFISFRSETINGDLTFIFDGDAKETKQLLGKLESMGALTDGTIEKLKDRGKKKSTAHRTYYYSTNRMHNNKKLHKLSSIFTM